MNITNRELLRNYKDLKDRLVSGQVQQIRIEQRDGTVLKFTVEKKAQTPFESLIEYVKKNPVYVERPPEDLFDERK